MNSRLRTLMDEFCWIFTQCSHNWDMSKLWRPYYYCMHFITIHWIGLHLLVTDYFHLFHSEAVNNGKKMQVGSHSPWLSGQLVWHFWLTWLFSIYTRETLYVDAQPSTSGVARDNHSPIFITRGEISCKGSWNISPPLQDFDSPINLRINLYFIHLWAGDINEISVR